MRLILLALSFILTSWTGAEQLSAVDKDSEIKFRIKNLGVGVNGSFNGLEGKFEFDPHNLSSSTFEASIDVNSINTGINMRDNHLRSEDYFDVKNYPRIKFVSTKVVENDKEGNYVIYGKLTIKKTTKEISFPFTASPENGGIRFKGEFSLDRRDYKVGGYSMVLSDKLTVFLSVFAKK
jgi:polyisoprenoid-binding protein YceI